ncbi:MAG: hypothetical protein DBX47_03890 [Clostridiales bacterium]|nr:MAG: hypothetical protein DBX47_03890 [Clostridiales bacterium]
MKKVLKISIFLFLSAVVLGLALFFGIKYYNEQQAQKKEQEQTFDRKPLDEASIFGDYVFEQVIREKIQNKDEPIDIESLAEITELDLSFNGKSTDEDKKIISLSGLKYFKGLKKLTIDRNMCSSFTGIEECVDLEYLSAQDCRFFNATQISLLTNLKYLNLRNNEIRSTEFIKTLKNLEYLNLSGCNITDFAFLSEVKMNSIKELYIASTGFNQMEWIYLLPNIERLDVSGNELNDELLAGIEILTKLEYLKASSQNIKSTAVFKDCKNLKTLILDVNRITDISDLSSLKNLEELNVNSNLIEKVDVLSDMKNLKRIYAKNNQIKSFTAISDIKFEKEDFSENPAKR